MKIIKVGLWNCPVCGYEGNKGPVTRCEKCGSSRPENVEFYLPENAETVTDETEIKKAQSGADWVCSYCSAHNKVYEPKCRSCGNTRNEKEGDKGLAQKVVYRAGDENKIKTAPPQNIKPQSNKAKKIGCGCLSALAIVVGIFFFLSTFTSQKEVTVSDKSWLRTIEAEVYKQVEEEAWDLPSEASLISSKQDIYDYEKIFKGYETKTRKVKKKVGEEKYLKERKDLGNGHFEEVWDKRPVYKDVDETYQEKVYDKKPIYKTKYKFLIYRWKPEELKTSGGSDEPYWYDEQNTEVKNQEKYRLKKRKENYVIVVIVEGERHSGEIKYERWKNLKPGDKVKAEFSSVFGTFLKIIE